MKKTGIWLDKNKALIVTIENGKESLTKIPSNIEHFRIGGGSGTKLKGGPQDVVQDSKYLEREKHQLTMYFKNIADQIKNIDALVIFGPADTNKKLGTELHSKYKSIGDKIKDILKADSMTDNQVKALVRDYYSS
ncbi:hypothetical protein U0L90_10800 [Flavobacteriaceae sp. LMIT009]